MTPEPLTEQARRYVELASAFAPPPPGPFGSMEERMLAWQEFTRLRGEAPQIIAVLAERVSTLAVGLEELAAVADRIHSGDPSLDPEEWYAIRDYVKVALAGLGADPATQDKATAGGTASGGASSDPAAVSACGNCGAPRDCLTFDPACGWSCSNCSATDLDER